MAHKWELDTFNREYQTLFLVCYGCEGRKEIRKKTTMFALKHHRDRNYWETTEADLKLFTVIRRIDLQIQELQKQAAALQEQLNDIREGAIPALHHRAYELTRNLS